jgi:hypothetical protein
MSFRSHVRRRHWLCLLALSLAAVNPLTTPAGYAQEAPKENPPPAVDPVDYRKLKELLPNSLGDLKRADAEGGKQSVGELKLSQARGTYNEDGKEGGGSVSIFDYGAMPGMAEASAPWVNVDIDHESDTEYARTVKIGNYKGMETYNKEQKTGSIMLVVARRFIVQIEINDLAPEVLQETAKSMKLAELEALAK